MYSWMAWAAFEVEADGAAAVALLVDLDGRPALVLVEVADLEAAARVQPRTGIDVEVQDGAVAVGEQGVAGGQADELAARRW